MRKEGCVDGVGSMMRGADVWVLRSTVVFVRGRSMYMYLYTYTPITNEFIHPPHTHTTHRPGPLPGAARGAIGHQRLARRGLRLAPADAFEARGRDPPVVSVGGEGAGYVRDVGGWGWIGWFGMGDSCACS